MQPAKRFLQIPPEDRQLIAQEHERLAAFLRDLRETCSEFQSSGDCRECGKEKSASCQGLLVSFQHDFVALIEEHFEHEERIMRDTLSAPEDDAYFRQHVAEHTRLLDEIRNTLIPATNALSRQGQTAAAIRMLHDRVSEIFGQHAYGFDDALLE
jgi:hemerythrin